MRLFRFECNSRCHSSRHSNVCSNRRAVRLSLFFIHALTSHWKRMVRIEFIHGHDLILIRRRVNKTGRASRWISTIGHCRLTFERFTRMAWRCSTLTSRDFSIRLTSTSAPVRLYFTWKSFRDNSLVIENSSRMLASLRRWALEWTVVSFVVNHLARDISWTNWMNYRQTGSSSRWIHGYEFWE